MPPGVYYGYNPPPSSNYICCPKAYVARVASDGSRYACQALTETQRILNNQFQCSPGYSPVRISSCAYSCQRNTVK